MQRGGDAPHICVAIPLTFLLPEVWEQWLETETLIGQGKWHSTVMGGLFFSPRTLGTARSCCALCCRRVRGCSLLCCAALLFCVTCVLSSVATFELLLCKAFVVEFRVRSCT